MLTTLQIARAIAQYYGHTLTHRVATGEYRVNLIGGREATAYYATDLQDAIDTVRNSFIRARLLAYSYEAMR